MSKKKNYYNTADATATVDDIRLDETAYARGELLTGEAEFYVEGTTLVVTEGWLELMVK